MERQEKQHGQDRHDTTGPAISIVIPTFRRPEGLHRLLTSIQEDIRDRKDVVIVIVDNDAQRSAEAIVASARGLFNGPVQYLVENEPGVSNARNLAMKSVETRFVLFLDDDMEVVPPYLDTLLSSAKKLGSAITFGASVAKLPPETSHLSSWLIPLYSRTLEADTGIVDDTLGTGGCLIDLSQIVLLEPPFDPALNEVGGEDDRFFESIIAQGGTVGWCAEAVAWEHVPLHRTRPSYLWLRQFAFGQSPTRDAAEFGARGIPSVLKWMCVGLVQTLFHGGMFMAMSAIRRPSRAHHFARLAQGVGKILWWDSLSPKLYGSKAK